SSIRQWEGENAPRSMRHYITPTSIILTVCNQGVECNVYHKIYPETHEKLCGNRYNYKCSIEKITLFHSSSVVELSAVNRSVVGSNPTCGAMEMYSSG